MKSYPSIETVFVRDNSTKQLAFGVVRCAENDCIKQWTCSEKIDGTNVRVIVRLDGVKVMGRTDNACLHPDLTRHVESLFDHATLVEYFTAFRGKDLPPEWSVTFYGEGYGAGIQKGGHYSQTKRFRCFDLLLGESWWCADAVMRRVCADLSIPTVPVIQPTNSFPQTAVELIGLFGGTMSRVAIEDSGDHCVLPEGVVAKPLEPLLNVHGQRVVWKLTFREFGISTAKQLDAVK